MISRFARALAHHPIAVLRGDMPAHRDAIIAYTKRYGIREAPTLITRSDKVITGRANICAAIPILAREINEGSGGVAAPVHCEMHSDITFQDHQLRAAFESDDENEEEDAGLKIGQRIEEYKREMTRRGARILNAQSKSDAPGGQLVPPGAQPGNRAKMAATARASIQSQRGITATQSRPMQPSQARTAALASEPPEDMENPIEPPPTPMPMRIPPSRGKKSADGDARFFELFDDMLASETSV